MELQGSNIALVKADERLALRNWTVGQLLEHAAEEAPGVVAIKQYLPDGVALQWTYDALLRDTRRLASFLLGHFKPGENVAIWGANSAAWILYQLAAAQAGIILVTLNPALRAMEVRSLLEQSRAVGLVMDTVYRSADLIAIVESARADLPHLHTVLRIADWQDHIAAAPADRPDVAISPDDDALILYTSGTTGNPKGVVLQHRGIVNNALLGSERYELPDRKVWLGVLPFFHVGGSVTSILGCIARLGTNIVVPAFDAGTVLHLIETERVAWLPVVPTIVFALLEHEAFAATDLSSLHLVLTGGTIITPEFVRIVGEKFKVGVQVMFGQTEAGGAMAKTFRSDPASVIAGTVGRPYPHTAMKIADVQSGETLSAGETGEIRIKSPFMTRRYFDNPTATQAAFDADGFLRTGDLGMLDDNGYLRITGRLKEMIIRGGENIYPREIEDALSEFEGIVEVAVVGIPDPRWGEEVAVAVRCSPDATIDTDAARDFLLQRIARHKVPKLWRIVPDFPRTPSGKIQKFEVARWFDSPASS